MDADLARVARGVAVSRETEEAMTQVIAGAGVSTAQTMIQRPRTSVAPPPAPPAYRAPGYYDYEEPPRGRSVWPWLLALALIVAAGIGGWYLYTKIQDQLNNSKTVAVPNVLLLQKNLARLHIQQLGLHPRVRYGFSDTVNPGQVYDQDPQDGVQVKKDSPVTIFVSRGKEKFAVPDVVNQDVTSAVQMLAAAGMQVKITRIYSGSQPDTVTAQQPHAGDKVIKGTVVHINVSRGAKPIAVPDVTQQPYANAKSALQGAGFVVQRVDVESDSAQGVVVSETPQAGTSVSKGSTITLSVSKGPAATQVPDVTGSNQSTAEQILAGANLTPSIIYDPVTDPSQDGIVLSEDPKAGSPAKAGEVVIIHVGQLQQGTPGGDAGTTTTTTTTP
jgi:serine/threonine-protein kinase